ncbi:MAG: hypothetical protein M1829_006434 [Trizodia sp. TS-e1964]|nr:MAG: hypothetical protein M1829_006434 [Trizodia sp. TS-e1964]
MAAQNTTCYPPHIQHSSSQISTTAAEQHLAAFLAAAESHPHLQPNAFLTERGPVALAAGARAGGLAMHNLRRVLGSLRGEWDVGLDTVLDDRAERPGEARVVVPTEEWVDSETYRLGQGESSAEEAVGKKGAGVVVDKERRKKAKLERRRAEKREREARVQREKVTARRE